MENINYFDSAKGVGVLSTADRDGNVNSAIYSRPGTSENGNLVFLMADNKSHQNISANPKAVYLFKEDSSYTGRRIYLKMVSESEDPDLIKRYKRSDRDYSGRRIFVVEFEITGERPLIGS